jgi:hypothetical protein
VFFVNSGADLTLQNLTVEKGRAYYGGGIWNEGTATITNSTFSYNSALSAGGGDGAQPDWGAYQGGAGV